MRCLGSEGTGRRENGRKKEDGEGEMDHKKENEDMMKKREGWWTFSRELPKSIAINLGPTARGEASERGWANTAS